MKDKALLSPAFTRLSKVNQYKVLQLAHLMSIQYYSGINSQKVTMRSVLALLFVVVVGHWVTAVDAQEDQANVAFRDFISRQVSLFRGNMEGTMGVDDVQFNSQNPFVNVTYMNMTVRNLNVFGYDVSADLGGSRLSINFTTSPHVEGNYSMEGLSNDSIIVRGRGYFQLATTGIKWPGNCSIQVNADRHVTLNNFNFQLGEDPSAFGSFDGIDGYEIIGQNITSYLDSVASHSIPIIDSLALRVTTNDLLVFLNKALQNVTLDEIIGNTTLPTTTTTRPGQPDYVIDLISDLEGTGWSVPTSATCAYASLITGFLCSGSPVPVREPYDGRGFWMSPCRGNCTLEYADTTKLPKALGVQGFYSDFAPTARISVRLWQRGSIVREFHLTKDDGTYNEVDLSTYSYDGVTVSMENNGQGGFGILDALRVFN